MKKKVLLSSSLKPVNDTRMYEKFALTLCEQYEVWIIGIKNEESTLTYHENIHFLPIYTFNNDRNSTLKRAKTLRKWYREAKAIAPDIIIIHSLDLLLGGMIYKLNNPKKVLIYDVRENYKINIQHQKYYHGSKKHRALLFIYLIQKWSRSFIDFYFLAEKIFQTQLKFIKGKPFEVLENKFKNLYHLAPKISKKPTNNLQLVFTGTLGKWQGVERAVDLVEKLQQENINARLQIIGHFVDDEIAYFVRKKASEHIFLDHTTHQGKPVAHKHIVEAIQKADFAIISYYENKSILKRIPTKVYECLALQTPMILQKGATWESFCRSLDAGIFIDFENFDVIELWKIMQSSKFYTKPIPDETILWDSKEAEVLQKTVAQLI